MKWIRENLAIVETVLSVLGIIAFILLAWSGIIKVPTKPCYYTFYNQSGEVIECSGWGE